jgi:hypothetical protein
VSRTITLPIVTTKLETTTKGSYTILLCWLNKLNHSVFFELFMITNIDECFSLERDLLEWAQFNWSVYLTILSAIGDRFLCKWVVSCVLFRFESKHVLWEDSIVQYGSSLKLWHMRIYVCIMSRAYEPSKWSSNLFGNHSLAVHENLRIYSC